MVKGLRAGAIEEAVIERAYTAKMVQDCRKEKHVLIHERLTMWKSWRLWKPCILP
jgi:hypothetical protein